LNLSTARKTLVTFQLLFAGALSLPAASPAKIPLDTLQLNGTAILNSFGHITLTTDLNEAGSAFIPTPYEFGSTGVFGVSFSYHSQPYSTSPPADGLAFIVQNTEAGAAYLGLPGSGLGFFTQTTIPAIGVTFDYYGNAITGSPAGTLAIAAPAGIELAQTIPSLPLLGGSGTGGVRYVWVVYGNAAKTMAVYYSNTSTRPATPALELTLPQDISTLFGGQIYLGFSGGTGALDSIQSIDSLAVDVVNDGK
jgi:hypothetical protein